MPTSIPSDEFQICSTIFSLRQDTLKNYYNGESFRLFKKKYKEVIEEYIN